MNLFGMARHAVNLKDRCLSLMNSHRSGRHFKQRLLDRRAASESLIDDPIDGDYDVELAGEDDEFRDEDNEENEADAEEYRESTDDGAYEIELGGEGDVEEEPPDDGLDEQVKENKQDESEGPEHEVSALEAAIARVLDDGCAEVQQKLTEHLLRLKNRVVEREQRVQIAVEQRQHVIAKHEQLMADTKRERENLQTHLDVLGAKLRREQHERAEDSELISEFWPDSVSLSTLLVRRRRLLTPVGRNMSSL